MTQPKESRLKNIMIRLAAVAPLIPLLLFLMFWGHSVEIYFELIVLISTAIAGYELFRMVIPESQPLVVWGTISTAGFALGLAHPVHPLLPHAMLITLMTATLIAGLLVPDPVERAAHRSGWLLGGPLYVGGGLAHLILLRRFPDGGAWVLLSMFIAWLSDTGGYFAGILFGKHKLYPKLSPKKTIEGSVGGIIGSTIGAVALHFTLLPQLPLLDAVILAVLGAIIGQAGDLFESLLKRSTGVKDSGHILPGHGGILDRVDALLFTSMLTWAYVALILPIR